MKYSDMVSAGEKKLISASIDQRQSLLYINECLDISCIDRMNDIDIPIAKIKKYNKVITRLLHKEPIQYIIGNTDFYGRKFNINRATLIPRFETEELVENTIIYIKKYLDVNVSIIDVCTGSGVIGITLKKELPSSKVTITDISKRAIKVAKQNIKELECDIDVHIGDMLKKIIKTGKRYDVIISNPPYLKEDEEIMDIVKKNEPKIALYGGKDGLLYYRKLFKEASKILNNKWLIALEIGEKQGSELIKIANENFNNVNCEIKKDLQGRDRMVFIFKNLND